jgi:putative membrane protein
MMKKLILTLMAITIGLLISVNAFAFRPGAGYGCTFGFGYGNGGMFMGILFLILLGVVIYFIVQHVRLKNMNVQTQESFVDILKNRYAKGEITKEDFDRIKSELR